MKILKYIFIINMLILLNSISAYTQEEKKSNNVLENVLDNRFFSFGLYSSVDSVKTSVNFEFGFKIFKFKKFEIKSYTSIVGSKIFDDSPQMYELGFMQKITFGGRDEYMGSISVSRYGFTFASFGFLSFDPDRSGKYLFAKPFYWEVGGGAGFNINVSKHVAIVLEFGGGLHMVHNGKELDYPDKINKAGFGRISVGSRYYF